MIPALVMSAKDISRYINTSFLPSLPTDPPLTKLQRTSSLLYRRDTCQGYPGGDKVVRVQRCRPQVRMEEGRVVSRTLDEKGIVEKADTGGTKELGGDVGQFLRGKRRKEEGNEWEVA